ncbi:cubilin-like [Nematostella vectensis]|uniref:cubilin-like n=1 Tax=Nematostella vectensis TaxID=45351 RepID=UPI002076F0B2|nr:cubilin-like [Nematostella vectensis]
MHQIVTVFLAVVFSRRIHASDDHLCTINHTAISIFARYTNLAFDEIREPAFPSGHRPTDCAWQITAPAGHRIKFVIDELHLNHEKDRLTIYDGVSDTSAILVDYGPCAKGRLVLYSSGSGVLISLVSNSNAANGRLKILFKSLPPDTITCTSDPVLESKDYCNSYYKPINKSSGHLTSPEFPQPSPNRRCRWLLTSPPGYRVQVIFRWIGMDCLDPLEVSDTNSGTISKYCGCSELSSIVSSSLSLWIRFQSLTPRQPGFWITYRSICECI